MKLSPWVVAVTFLLSPAAISNERANLSIQDLIDGFEKERMFYFEMLLENGKYTRAFNKCLNSRPAAADWIAAHCQKNPELKNAFRCDEGGLTHVWFVYETRDKCEEVRKPMKDKMDALRQ